MPLMRHFDLLLSRFVNASVKDILKIKYFLFSSLLPQNQPHER